MHIQSDRPRHRRQPRMSRHSAPRLQRNGGGSFVNVLPGASWKSNPVLAGYAVTLREQGAQVPGAHVGMIDTGLTRGFDLTKPMPSDVATRAVRQGLAAAPPLCTLD